MAHGAEQRDAAEERPGGTPDEKHGRERLAAVDVGGNAARLLICDAGEFGIRRAAMARLPLRLGAPAYARGELGATAGGRLVECLRGFGCLCRSAGVGPGALRARATSALREAADGEHWARLGGEALGAELRVIDGRTEAATAARSVWAADDDGGILLDLGGGSADVCVFRTGKVLTAESFGVGAVRALAGKVSAAERIRFREWLARTAAAHGVEELTACGGNVRRLGKILSGGKSGGKVAAPALEELLEELRGLSPTERAERYGLRLDRADVIVPAAEVCCEALRAGGFRRLRVPRNAGLAEGMIREMATERDG